jgi:hypothetical protein
MNTLHEDASLRPVLISCRLISIADFGALARMLGIRWFAGARKKGVYQLGSAAMLTFAVPSADLTRIGEPPAKSIYCLTWCDSSQHREAIVADGTELQMCK